MDTEILSTGMAAVSLFCSIGIIWYLYRLRHPVTEKPKQPKAEKPKKVKKPKEPEEEHYIFAVPEGVEEEQFKAEDQEEEPPVAEEPEPTEAEIMAAIESEPNIDDLILAQLNGKSKMPKVIADEIGYPVARVRRRLQAMVKKKQARHTAKGYLKAKAKV